MKLTVYFTILISCYIVVVDARSLQADRDILQYLRIGTTKEVTTTESIDHAVWRILQQPSETNVHEKNENGTGDLENEPNRTSLRLDVSGNEVEGGKGTTESGERIDELSSAVQSSPDSDKEVTMKLEDDQTENSDKLMSQEVLTEPFPNAEMSESESGSDFNSKDALSSTLNITGDAILLQSLTDNSSLINSHDYDETSLLSDGSEIALFQEVSTVGFEMMIDSETKKNLLLAQMLSTEVLTEDGEEGTLLSHFSPDEDSFLTANFNTTVNVKIINKLGKNETLQGEKNKLDLNSENITKEESASENITKEESASENITKEESASENITKEESASENVTSIETISVQTERPKCPEPGWCLMFFLALDTCAEDSHCDGPRICCKWRCSMTCIDVDNLDT